ncbi:hypothetical protein CAEBREN_32410 [Caenorhabditis brenneri]|uniref:F-box associated domain-containing protein n=1 Tax=Caenorhabditis brenneri TaxID=135651 RepID=G0NCN9_CAEBE|nr:hypothetical protein CAEBREN_32410 [Caenorhabditis brenneri]
MKPIDVILLTMVSTPFKQFIKCYKLSRVDMIFNFHGVLPRGRAPDTDGNNFGVDLLFDDSPPLTFVFPKVVKEFARWRNVNGKPMQVGTCLDNAILFGGDRKMKKKMEYMEQMVKHLVDIFYVDEYFLSSTEKYKLFDFFVWDFVPKFYEIHLGCLRQSYYVTAGQLSFLLNSVKCDHLNLSLTVYGKLGEIQLKSKSLEVSRFGDWLTMDHIIESECEEITGQIDEAEPAKTVELVKEWQNGKKLTNLKMLDLGLGCIDQSPALKIIDKFDGVKELTEEEKKILKEGEMKENCPSGEVRKIRRATDGKIAVLSVNEDRVEMTVLKNGKPLKNFESESFLQVLFVSCSSQTSNQDSINSEQIDFVQFFLRILFFP